MRRRLPSRAPFGPGQMRSAATKSPMLLINSYRKHTGEGWRQSSLRERAAHHAETHLTPRVLLDMRRQLLAGGAAAG